MIDKKIREELSKELEQERRVEEERRGVKISMVSGVCPECIERMSKRRRDPDYDDISAMIWVVHTDQWIDEIIVDCDHTSDHVVRASGAWTNPIIKKILSDAQVTKRAIKAAAMQRDKMIEENARDRQAIVDGIGRMLHVVPQPPDEGK